ncbi:MAG: hypothetical protein CVU77_01895 [Elusimicrobia bacterium HGW-Elusimicrobia-1]|jgi:hypothetical protein|nr:MAG: hypothetical protein CVU77_01895 [Elusimicrobia bacterium HGW-Elusimicrobia-1]
MNNETADKRNFISAVMAKISACDPVYPLSFIAVILVQTLLFLKTGPHPSTDFMVVYEPAAYDLLSWLKHGNTPSLAWGYLFFHYFYVIYIAAIYAIFGAGNRAALAIIQIIFFSVSVPVVYATLKKYLTFKYIAVFFTFLYVVFFDNVHLASYLVVDHLYKASFIIGYALIIHFYAENKSALFAFSLIVSSIVLMFLRIDTLFLFLPLYIMAAKLFLWREKANKKAIAVFCAVAAGTAVLFMARGGGKVLASVTDLLSGWFQNGDVIVGLGFRIPGVTYIEDFDASRGGDIIYLFARISKLFVLRVYHFLNIWPIFWSRGHKLYYALHMSLIYSLAAMGIWRAFKERNIFFKTSSYVILMSVIMHGLTRVDSALRTMYTPLAILIMLAAYGLDGTAKRFLSTQKE